jgi:tRNA(fMet)-specific endonuclease VapC
VGGFVKVAKARTTAQYVDASRKLSKHADLYRRLGTLELDVRAGAEFDRLESSRLQIGTKGLQIAVIVLSHDATLLTRNLCDFRKVPGLKLADWTS